MHYMLLLIYTWASVYTSKHSASHVKRENTHNILAMEFEISFIPYNPWSNTYRCLANPSRNFCKGYNRALSLDEVEDVGSKTQLLHY